MPCFAIVNRNQAIKTAPLCRYGKGYFEYERLIFLICDGIRGFGRLQWGRTKSGYKGAGLESIEGGKDRKVLRSIAETRKLFTVQSVAGGKVNVVVTTYLLSLPENKQREVLSEHLDRLTRDWARYKSIQPAEGMSQEEKINRTQLQLMIQVIEGLLAQI
jgi:hypothetical protein